MEWFQFINIVVSLVHILTAFGVGILCLPELYYPGVALITLSVAKLLHLMSSSIMMWSIMKDSLESYFNFLVVLLHILGAYQYVWVILAGMVVFDYVPDDRRYQFLAIEWLIMTVSLASRQTNPTLKIDR